MNGSEMAKALAKQAGLTNAEAARVIKALFDGNEGIIATALADCIPVQITGFGGFHMVYKAAHEARNPATGDTIQVPDKNIVRFKVGKTLAERIS